MEVPLLESSSHNSSIEVAAKTSEGGRSRATIGRSPLVTKQPCTSSSAAGPRTRAKPNGDRPSLRTSSTAELPWLVLAAHAVARASPPGTRSTVSITGVPSRRLWRVPTRSAGSCQPSSVPIHHRRDQPAPLCKAPRSSTEITEDPPRIPSGTPPSGAQREPAGSAAGSAEALVDGLRRSLMRWCDRPASTGAAARGKPPGAAGRG